MSKYFMNDSVLQKLEQLMMMVPNFLRRSSGVIVVHDVGKESPQKREDEGLPPYVLKMEK